MNIRRLEEAFSVCRLADVSGFDPTREFCFFARTPDEISLVCLESDVPENAEKIERGWCAFRVEGQLDFGLVGILSKITGALASEGIPVFAVSTFDTDYILVKQERAADAEGALAKAGYAVTR